jgi:hypothetical protein
MLRPLAMVPAWLAALASLLPPHCELAAAPQRRPRAPALRGEKRRQGTSDGGMRARAGRDSALLTVWLAALAVSSVV